MKIYFNKKISKQNFNKGTSKFTIIEYLTDSGKYTIKNNKLVQYVLENLNSKGRTEIKRVTILPELLLKGSEKYVENKCE